MSGYVDSHCHIACDAYDNDRNEVIQRMKDNDVVRALIICCPEDEYDIAFDLVDRDELFDMAVGIHPSDQKKLTPEWWNHFLEVARDPRVKVIGEIGLDYYWDQDNKEEQRELFIKQIELAKQLNKPISVHSREATQESFDILKKHRVKGVIHCFSGSLEIAKEYTKMGYYVALGGPVTYKNSKDPKKVAKEIDINYLLTETDCPYLSPSKHRGERNEPSYVIHALKKIAELREMDEEVLKEQIVKNYDRFMGE